MERTAVNPVTWSLEMGFNQGEVVSGHSRTLYISGQTTISRDGKPEHDGDVAAQLGLAMDNLEAVLTGAGIGLTNLVRLNVYTTDVDALFPHYGVLAGRLAAAGVAPTTTMLGVTDSRSLARWSSSKGSPSREAAHRWTRAGRTERLPSSTDCDTNVRIGDEQRPPHFAGITGSRATPSVRTYN